jgi:hypothetical protein
MANIRDLKKDLKWLTYEVLTDCMIAKLLNDKKTDDVEEVMHEMMNQHNDLITRINESKRLKESKEKRQEFKAIEKDMYASADNAFKKLSELIK